MHIEYITYQQTQQTRRNHSMTCKTMKTIPSSDIYTYEKQALDSLPTDHPNYEEIKELLINQINDDLKTNANSCPN